MPNIEDFFTQILELESKAVTQDPPRIPTIQDLDKIEKEVRKAFFTIKHQT